MNKSHVITLSLIFALFMQVGGYKSEVSYYEWNSQAITNTTSSYSSFNGTVVIPSYPGMSGSSVFNLGVLITNQQSSGAFFNLAASDNEYQPVIGVQISSGEILRKYFSYPYYLTSNYAGCTITFGGSFHAQDASWTVYMNLEGGESTRLGPIPVLYGAATEAIVNFGGEIGACSDIGSSGSLEIDVEWVTSGVQSGFVVNDTYSGDNLGCDVTVKPAYPTFTFMWNV